MYIQNYLYVCKENYKGKKGRVSILFIGLLFLFMFFISTPSFAISITGISHTGQLISINPLTGAGTLIGNTGLNSVDSLEQDANGNLIAIANGNDLYRIDPFTLSTIFLADLVGFSYIEGLAFNNDRTILYGAASNNNDVSAERLVTIDINNGVATEVGIFGNGANDVDGLAMSPNNVLYGTDIGGVDGSRGFYSINITTGLASLISIPEVIIGLDFSPDGTLYGTTMAGWPNLNGGPSRLVRIETTTGNITDIGAIGFDTISGIVVSSSTPVPEPSTIMLLGFSLVGFIGFRIIVSRITKDKPRGQRVIAI